MKSIVWFILCCLIAITVSLGGPMSTQSLASDLTKVELTEVEGRGIVGITVSGNGLEYINVILESKSSEPLEVTISPGTIFEAQSAGVQNMVVREKQVVFLQSRGISRSLTIPAACVNMRRHAPEEKNTFTIRKTPTPEDLIKLLNLPEFHNEDFRVQQFAIWTITDNPSRYGYVGIGYFGFGEGPTKEEIRRIRTLFARSAGISVKKYRALH